MLGWLRRALTPPEPSRPRLEARLTQLENQYDDIDSRLDYIASELKKVRGRQFALEKRAQDGAGETNDGGASPVDQPPPARQYLPTAFLSRRFKGG